MSSITYINLVYKLLKSRQYVSIYYLQYVLLTLLAQSLHILQVFLKTYENCMHDASINMLGTYAYLLSGFSTVVLRKNEEEMRRCIEQAILFSSFYTRQGHGGNLKNTSHSAILLYCKNWNTDVFKRSFIHRKFAFVGKMSCKRCAQKKAKFHGRELL